MGVWVGGGGENTEAGVGVGVGSRGTREEWEAEKPTKTPSRERGAHFGMELLFCSTGSRMYMGHPKTCARWSSFKVIFV